MASSRNSFRAYLLCFITFFVSTSAKEYVPTLIWESSSTGSKEISPPSLAKLSSDEFSDYLSQKLSSFKEKPLVVVFAEENLSVEDFSWQDKFEQGSYPLLEGITKESAHVSFLPSVYAPLPTLDDVLTQHGFIVKTIDLANESPEAVSAEDGSALLIKLDDARGDEDRPKLLYRHDEVISSVFTSLLAKHPNIIAIYTGRYSSFTDVEPESVHRVRRLLASNDSVSDSDRLWTDADKKIFMYFFKSFPILQDAEKNDSKIELSTHGPISIDTRDTYQRLIVVFSVPRKITLRFKFPAGSPGYWLLNVVEMEDSTLGNRVLTTNQDIEVANRFSYHCSNSIVFRNGSVSLTLTDVQIQPNMTSGKFSDAYDCATFFTAPIWTGIFVTVLLAMIMTWGITMIMDIKTMDRFDDPKGKTIQIGAVD